jgi:nitrogen regulatory protein PII
MKGIKVYIRPDVLGITLDRLEKAGAKITTVDRVEAIGGIADADKDSVRLLSTTTLPDSTLFDRITR